MRKVKISDLSSLKCDFYSHSCEPSQRTVLVVAVEGEYRPGSAGNKDAAYLSAKTLGALVAFDPDAVILDFRRLSYSWGNGLLGVFQAVDQFMNQDKDGSPFPVMAVTSDLCRDALLSLCGTNEAEAHWHYRNLDDALAAATEAAGKWLEG